MMTNHEIRQGAVELLEKQQREIANYVNHCIATIILSIDECGGLIHDGNFNLFTRTNVDTGERIVYFLGSWLPYNPEHEKEYNEAIELYSEDGWDKLEDLANWADIARHYAKEHSLREKIRRAEEEKNEKKSMD